MFYFILTIHIILCLAMIFLVLLQQGKGADLGAALGGSGSAFGPGSSANVLTRATTGVAVAFMVTSIILVRTYGEVAPALAVRSDSPDSLRGSVMEGVGDATEVTEESSPEAAEESADGVLPEPAALPQQEESAPEEANESES